MHRSAVAVVVVCAGLTGCVPEKTHPSLLQVERRVATLVGDNEGGHAEAKCAELSDRAFRCELSVNGVPSTYDARLEGERIQLEKR